MNEYKRFLAIWDCVHIMNTAGIFTYGYADQRNGDFIISFETTEQRQRYQIIFETPKTTE